jgi:hypothetical protein
MTTNFWEQADLEVMADEWEERQEALHQMAEEDPDFFNQGFAQLNDDISGSLDSIVF